MSDTLNPSQAVPGQKAAKPDIVKKSGEQKAAEARVDAFRKSLGPFVVAAEKTRMPMIFTDAKDPANPIVFANDAFLKLTGYDRKEVLGQDFNDLLARGVEAETLAQVKAAFDGTSVDDPIIHYRRKDSSEFWASMYISPVCDQAGAILQYFISLIDLTKLKAEQSHSLMLIDELNHRVKNTLQAVQAIVWEGFRYAADIPSARESIQARIFALSRSHDLLMSEDWEGAGLLDLVKTTFQPFTDMDQRQDRVVITGENIHLPPRATLALGIAFHELAMNAVKFGALSNEAGSILVAWETEATPKGKGLVLRWQEKDGPPVPSPTRKGLGSRVLEQRLAQEMGGTVDLDFKEGGVVCTMKFPLPRKNERG